MSDTSTVEVFEIVGGPLCVSADDGQLVHDRIADDLRAGKKIVVSFKNIETIISAFLNAAIGQLYGEFSEEQIRQSLSVQEMSPEDLNLLKRVVDNAKIYFQNQKQFDDAWRGEVGDEE